MGGNGRDQKKVQHAHENAPIIKIRSGYGRVGMANRLTLFAFIKLVYYEREKKSQHTNIDANKCMYIYQKLKY